MVTYLFLQGLFNKLIISFCEIFLWVKSLMDFILMWTFFIFDICLSFYSFHTTNNYERFKRLGKPPSKAVSFCLNHSFKDYIKSKHCFSYFDRIYTYNNVFSIDFIIRQENLENDFLKLCQTLKLKEIKLEKLNLNRKKIKKF